MSGGIIKCKDCGAQFLFTDGEALFFSQRGLTVPKRCPDCRAQRRGTKQQQQQQPEVSRGSLGDALMKHLGGKENAQPEG